MILMIYFLREVVDIWGENKSEGLFCERALYKRRYSAKETYNLKEPTNRNEE